MLRLVLVRLLWSVPLLFVVSLLTFVLTAFTPGDAARSILGTNTDPAAYAHLRAQLHLDQPLVSQYLGWLGHAVRGDLGASVFTGQPVVQALNSRLEVSLSLILVTCLVCGVLGVAIGALSAVRGGLSARGVDAGSMIGMSLPTPWLGLVLVLLLAITVRVFPASGYIPLLASPGGWVTSLVLPVACLAAGGVAVIARQTRGAMVDAFRRDHVRALRATGLPASRIVLRHVLKNAAVPVVTTLGVLAISLLGGTVVVEQVFALPGLGQAAVAATAQHDLPVLEGIVIYFTVLVIAFNLVVDVVNAWLDPKVVAA